MYKIIVIIGAHPCGQLIIDATPTGSVHKSRGDRDWVPITMWYHVHCLALHIHICYTILYLRFVVYYDDNIIICMYYYIL